MKKTIANSLVALCIAPFLLQCATREDVKTLSFRFRTLDNRLSLMERDINEMKKITGLSADRDTVDDVQKRQARMGDTIERLKTDLLQIKGQLDVNSNQFSQIQQKSKDIQANLTSQIDNISAKTDLIADQLGKTSADLEKANVEVEKMKETNVTEAAEQARLAAKQAEEARAKAARAGGPRNIEPAGAKKKGAEGDTSTPASSSGTTASDGQSDDAIYDNAVSAFNAKKYKEAYDLFSKYVEKHPKGKMLPNARFWLADSLFNQKEYEQAILEYQQVIRDYPNHNKAPAALLKQGLAFEKINDIETAEIVFRKLLEVYPKSEQAATAKKWLDEKRGT